ncbi:MAG: MBL fold metallo-hydrolase [Syntrophomonas sp.]|nr:MBL fold metallo-hydrolase [Syntrophomonas sp.]
MAEVDYKITFWGVRGSLPVPGSETIKYGGNTPCVQIQIGNRLFIMDAGTGIYQLGQHLIKQGQPTSGDIFITHTHWDHIQGFPFFTPAFIKGNKFALYGIRSVNLTFEDLMKGQMEYDHFPVSLDEMGSSINFHELAFGMEMQLGDDIVLRTVWNNHPGGCLSYRLDHKGRSCCYMTDTEHTEKIKPDFLKFAAGADVIIYDSHFTDAEYAGYEGFPSVKGWGHSTWQEGIKLVKACGAKKLVLFHHATYRSDIEMDAIEHQAQEQYSDVFAAREGMVISL